MSNGLRDSWSAPLRDSPSEPLGGQLRSVRAIDSLMTFARAILSYRVCAVSFNSDVEADEALGRCAPSGLRSLTPVVRRTTEPSGM